MSSISKNIRFKPMEKASGETDEVATLHPGGEFRQEFWKPFSVYGGLHHGCLINNQDEELIKKKETNSTQTIRSYPEVIYE